MIMNNTNILKSLIVLLCCFSTVYCSAIERLFNHREELEKREIAYVDKYRLLNEMRYKNLEEWKEREDEVFRAFLSLCAVSLRTSYGPNYHLVDTLLITLLIETIGELPPIKNTSLDFRFKQIPYPYLSAYRTKIIKKLEQIEDISKFVYAAALIDPPETMKKQLLSSKRLIRDELGNNRHGLRARLGDKDSENKLIERLDSVLILSIEMREVLKESRENSSRLVDSTNRAFGYRRYLYREIIDDLFLCGTDECLKTALKFFATFQPRLDSVGRVHKAQYGTQDPGIIESPRELIICGFRKYHPELPLLHAEFDSLRRGVNFKVSEMFGIIDNLDIKTVLKQEETIVKYMGKFVDWGNRKYGTNFKLESKLLLTGQFDSEISPVRIKQVRNNRIKEHERLIKGHEFYRNSWGTDETFIKWLYKD